MKKENILNHPLVLAVTADVERARCKDTGFAPIPITISGISSISALARPRKVGNFRKIMPQKPLNFHGK